MEVDFQYFLHQFASHFSSIELNLIKFQFILVKFEVEGTWVLFEFVEIS
jgi:hypothetical protein